MSVGFGPDAVFWDVGAAGRSGTGAAVEAGVPCAGAATGAGDGLDGSAAGGAGDSQPAAIVTPKTIGTRRGSFIGILTAFAWIDTHRRTTAETTARSSGLRITDNQERVRANIDGLAAEFPPSPQKDTPVLLRIDREHRECGLWWSRSRSWRTQRYFFKRAVQLTMRLSGSEGLSVDGDSRNRWPSGETSNGSTIPIPPPAGRLS